MATSRAVRPRRVASAGLLELDAELGCLLGPERRAAAARGLRVRVLRAAAGDLIHERLSDADPSHLGLLIADGVVARQVLLMDTVSTELLGPGDVVRPWHTEGRPELLPAEVRCSALSELRLGVLDRVLGAQLGAYPEIVAVIAERMGDRAQRLAITQAISQLNRVDRRLLALFWHLAERWGHVTGDGISVPLALSHRLLGELIGARRPTVSTALAELAREGSVLRRADGTWLLAGDPPSQAIDAIDGLRRRRRFLPGAPRDRELDVLEGEIEALRARVLELRARAAEA